jgi:hypothetical protein
VIPPNRELVRRCVRLLMDRPQRKRPDALLVLDDHLVPSAGEALADCGVATQEDLLFFGYSNFPDRPRSDVPLLRIGFDIHALFERMLAAVERQRRTGRLTRAALSPVFEEELRAAGTRAAPGPDGQD